MYKLCVYSRSVRVWQQESAPGECFLKWLRVGVWQVNFRSFFKQKVQGQKRQATRGWAFSYNVSTWNKCPSEWQAAESTGLMAAGKMTHTHTHTHSPPPYQRCWLAAFGPRCLLANITFHLTTTCLITSGQSALSFVTSLPYVTFPTDISLTSLSSMSSVGMAAMSWVFSVWRVGQQQWWQDVCSQ